MRTYQVVIAALLSSAISAQAADLSNPAPPAFFSPSPVTNWTGFYLGADAGANIFGNDTTGVRSRALAGLRAGYNLQFERFVTGVQGDINWRPYSVYTSQNWSGTVSGTLYNNVYRAQANYISTVTARAGYLINNDLLAFASGGLALGGLDLSTTINGLAGARAGAYGQNSVSDLRTGWVAGGGVEYVLSSHWSIEGQYQYCAFPTKTLYTSAYLSGRLAATSPFSLKGAGNLLSLTANYHF